MRVRFRSNNRLNGQGFSLNFTAGNNNYIMNILMFFYWNYSVKKNITDSGTIDGYLINKKFYFWLLNSKLFWDIREMFLLEFMTNNN